MGNGITMSYLKNSSNCLAFSCCASLSILIYASSAVAQEAEPTVVEEVVVTAQRREQAIQDVPISIQAIAPQALQDAGINNTRDLMAIVPGLNFAIKGVFAQPVLRGISNQGPGVDAAVSTYLDGVYQFQPAAGILELPDVEGIEVLKGPQGTLYGRNASGGAILVRTRRPSFTPGGTFSASYGTYNEIGLNGYITGPIVNERLAFGLSGSYRARDAYIDDLVRGGKIGNMEGYSYRGSLRFQPSETADIILTAYHTSLDDPTAYLGIAQDQNSLSRRVDPTQTVATRPYTTSVGDIPFLLSESSGATLNATFDFGLGKLTSTTGYIDTNAHILQDADMGPARGLLLAANYPAKMHSQEFSFATRDFGAWSFLAGALYLHQDQVTDLTVNAGASHTYGNVVTDAYAAYGEAQWHVTERLTGIFGARYSYEEKDYAGFRGTGFAIPTTQVALADANWDTVTPRVSLSYELNDSTNLYVTYNQAFKSGAFNPSGLINTPVNPETVTAFEVGSKTIFSRGRLNIAIFDYKFEDLQVSATVTTPTGTASLLQNAASAKIRGLDIDGELYLTDSIKISGGFSWLDQSYESFPNATVNVPFATCPGASPCGNFATVIDASGFPISRTPDFTGTLNAEYRRPLAHGELRLTGNAYYNSGFSWEPGNRLRQGAYTTFGATAVYSPEATDWDFTVGVRNLTDEVYTIQSADSAGGDAVSFAQPRSYFVTVRYRY